MTQMSLTAYAIDMQQHTRVMAKRPVGRPRRYIAPEHVQELRSQGLSFRQIARKTGFGYGTVRRALLTAH
jgi:DNA invertase Pin-like site-specific DNA recombinase